ncbi:unnamed protein product [Alternaria alternata]|jgi:hypothetical protein
MVTFLGLFLATIWALSPVGGQASFRQVTTGNKTYDHTTSFDYMVPDGILDVVNAGSDNIKWWGVIDNLFIAALVGPATTKASPRDLWGNVRIPHIETFEEAVSADSDGWFKVQMDQNTNTSFASLLGVPMTGLNDKDAVRMSMNLQTLYLALDCKGIPRYRHDSWEPRGVFHANISSNAHLGWDDPTNITLPGNVRKYGPERQIPFQFYLGSSWWNATNGNLQCQITTTYVEVEIFCPTGTTCAASKIRRSRLSHPREARTQFDFHAGSGYPNWQTFATSFIMALKSGKAYSPTMLDLYLVAPEDPLLALQTAKETNPNGTEVFANYTTASNRAYSLNLGQLFNAYWACMNGFYALSGGLTDLTSYTDDNTTFAGLAINPSKKTTDRFKTRAWSTVGTKYTEEIVIQADKGWATVLAFTSSLLILASLIPAVFRTFLTNGPDIMMNMSSLAMRDNPYVALPPTGSFLEASDRARILKDVKIRFGDAKSTSEVGRLAVGSAGDSEGWTIERVKRHRLCE